MEARPDLEPKVPILLEMGGPTRYGATVNGARGGHGIVEVNQSIELL